MKNNYPIKYAAMPIIEQTGRAPGLNELEREYRVVCYIVSKCYVVGREEKYNMYGNTECKYKVVFPYERDNLHRYLLRVEPNYNCYGECRNSINVDKVFDNFEEAREDALKKNKKIVNKKISFLHCDDNFLQNVSLLRKEQDEKVNKYRKIERMMENNSSDLVVNDQVKEQSVIIERNNSYKKKECSLYDMIGLYNSVYSDEHFMSLYDDTYSVENFIAYNVSLEDYKKIEEQLKNGEQLDIDSIKKNCLLLSSSDDKKMKVINYDSTDKSCFYIEDGYLYYDDKIDFSLDSISGNTLVVYTMESYNDVISSYIVNSVISRGMPKNKDTEKVFRREIKLR